MFSASRFFINIALFLSIAIPTHAQFLSVTLDAPIEDPITGDELRLGTAMMLILASDSSDPADLDFSSPFFIGGDDTSLMFTNNVYNPLCYYDQSTLAAYGITEYPVCYSGMNIDYQAHGFSSGETISVYARFFNNLAGTAPDGFDMPQQGSFDESGTLRQYMYGDYTDTYYADTEVFSFSMPTSMVADDMLIIPEDFSIEINTSQLVWEKAASDDNTTAPQLVPYPESTSTPDTEPEDNTTPTQSNTPDSSDTDSGSDDTQQPSTSTGQDTETPSESTPETDDQTTEDTQQPDPTPDPDPATDPDPVTDEPQGDSGAATTDQEPELLDPEIIEILDRIEYAGIYIEERPQLKIIDLCATSYQTTAETHLEGGVPVVPEPGAIFLSAWGFFFLVRHMVRKKS